MQKRNSSGRSNRKISSSRSNSRSYKKRGEDAGPSHKADSKKPLRETGKPFREKRDKKDGNSFGSKRTFDSGSAYKDKRTTGGKGPQKGKKSDFSKPDEEGKKPTRFSGKPSFRSDKPRSNKPFEGKSARKGKTSNQSGFFSKEKRGDKRSPEVPDEAAAQTEKIRLNKFIANSGVCSRREADQLITMGLISVNGKTITELGYKVNPGDEVRHESKVLRAEKPVYILVNKPKGYITTTNDPQERNTVMHLIGNTIKERIYPVGRLDRNTTGLLLLTNDGDLADKLMHPSYNAKKIYKAELDRPLTKADYQRIVEGVHLEEGKAIVDDLAIISDDGKTVGLELHIGWNRVVRRIFEALEYEVLKLDRSVYAGLDKKDLPRGHWRHLKKEEIIRLKHYK